MNMEQFKMLCDLAREAGDGALWIVLIAYGRYYLTLLAYAIVVPMCVCMIRKGILGVVKCVSASDRLLPENVYHWNGERMAKAKQILDKHWHDSQSKQSEIANIDKQGLSSE